MAMASGHLLQPPAASGCGGAAAVQDFLARDAAVATVKPGLQSLVGLSGAARKELRWTCKPKQGLVTRSSTVAEPAVAVDSQRVSRKFAELKKAGKIAFIPYLVAGDPDLDTTKKALLLLDSCGADVLELGVPYTDPLADGPVIQDASTRALNNGVTLDSVLELLQEISPKLKAPVVLFTYYNPIIKRGMENFLESIKSAGASGLLVPDLVLEDTEELRVLTAKHGLELVLLTTPTTPVERMQSIATATQGFLYLVSLTGVTGARGSVSGRVQHLLRHIKEASATPVAVGFGVSKPEHAIQLVEWGADGIIIGSAIVKLLGEAASQEEGLAVVQEFSESIRAAV